MIKLKAEVSVKGLVLVQCITDVFAYIRIFDVVVNQFTSTISASGRLENQGNGATRISIVSS